MSCSEQSAFHGQAADPVWFFSELLFQSVAAKKKKKRNQLQHYGTKKKEKERELPWESNSETSEKKNGLFLITSIQRIAEVKSPVRRRYLGRIWLCG